MGKSNHTHLLKQPIKLLHFSKHTKERYHPYKGTQSAARRPGPRPKYHITPQNGVTSCVIQNKHKNARFDLAELAKLVGGRMSPGEFPAVILNFHDRGSANIFSSGSAMIVGAVGMQAILCAWRIATVINGILRKCIPQNAWADHLVFVQNVRFINMSGTGCLGFEVDLDAMDRRYRGMSTYNPGVYSSLVMRIENNGKNATCSVFQSGSIVITGVDSIADLLAVMDRLYPMVAAFAKPCDLKK